MKSFLSKVNFALGRNPRIEHSTNSEQYIPDPYRAVVTITADFELAWAWRYSKRNINSFEFALAKARLERKNTPKILSLCEEYNIPVTWATVGHLFLTSCEKKFGLPHAELPRLNNFENNYWRFSGSDWFEFDPCQSVENSPEWYSPDLIDSILSSSVKHEIGCHTFSHIDCRDEVCPKEVFVAEIELCKKLAQEKGITLKSFVHPGHTIGNLEALVELGFRSFQSNYQNTLGYPRLHLSGIWELPRTYEFYYRPEWSVKYQISRYKKIVDRALANKTVCNFWFHPSASEIFWDRILPDIFHHLKTVSSDLLISTVENYTNWLYKAKEDYDYEGMNGQLKNHLETE